MYKILIADDHAVVRQGLKRILATASDMTVVGEAGSRLDVLTMLRQSVDALTLDLAMPGTDGMALLTEVKTLYRSLPIVVLSMYSDPPYVKRALKLGALGFIPRRRPRPNWSRRFGRSFVGDPMSARPSMRIFFIRKNPLARYRHGNARCWT